jgi:hypothetical protein
MNNRSGRKHHVFAPQRVRVGQKVHTGDIPARTVEISDQSKLHRVCANSEYNRNDRGGSLGLKSSGERIGCGDYAYSLANQLSRLQGLSYRFFESKLYSLWMFVDVRHYSQIWEMLVGKYGKPTREKASTVENRAGASFDDIITEWDFREGTLKLRYVQIDSSWLTFKNPTVEKQIRERRAAIDQEKGKSAF